MRRHFNKTKALGTARFPVDHDLGRGNTAELGKIAFQGGVGDGADNPFGDCFILCAADVILDELG